MDFLKSCAFREIKKCQFPVSNGAFLHDMGEKSTLVDFFAKSVENTYTVAREI